MSSPHFLHESRGPYEHDFSPPEHWYTMPFLQPRRPSPQNRPAGTNAQLQAEGVHARWVSGQVGESSEGGHWWEEERTHSVQLLRVVEVALLVVETLAALRGLRGCRDGGEGEDGEGGELGERGQRGDQPSLCRGALLTTKLEEW